MKPSIKISIIFLACILPVSCRTAKPTASSEVVADSLTVSKDSLSEMSHDSVSISQHSKTISYERIGFVEGGGTVSVSADGSVLLSGIAEVKSSRLRTAETKGESISHSECSQSNESVSDTHQATSVSESHIACSASRINWKLNTAVLMLIALLIPIMVRRLWKDTL